MKKYREFIIPLVMIVLIFSMALPSSAAGFGDPVTMKQLFGYGNGVVAASWLIDDTYIASNFFWVSDNSIRITDPADGNPWPDNPDKDGGSLTVTYSNLSFPVSSNDVLLFNCDRLWIYPLGNDTANLGTYELTFSFLFKDYLGVEYSEVAYSGSPEYFVDGTSAYSFDFTFNIPSHYKQFSGIQIRTTFYDANFTGYRLSFEAHNWEWYLGPESSAPVYGSPDTSYLDDLKAQEDSLREQTVGGIQDAGNVLGVLSQVIGPGTSAGEGLLGVTALLTPVFEPFQSFLLISLSIGLIMFIIGTVGSIHSSASSARVRDLKANYYKNKSGKGG